jgi:hypothetical protein
MEVKLKEFLALVPQPMASRISGIVLIDATGKEYAVSMDFAKSYEVCVQNAMSYSDTLPIRLLNNIQTFAKAMALLLEGDKMEARIQRRYMKQGRFDLCIDQGTQIVPINGQSDWSNVEPGTKVVMRAILVREQLSNTQRFKCPRCKAWNDANGTASASTASIDW